MKPRRMVLRQIAKPILTPRFLLVVLLPAVLLGCSPDRQDHAERSADALERRLEKLRSIPYTSVTDEKVDETRSGVTAYDRDRAYHGYNLFCSRVAPEVVLLDMEGRPVHSWRYKFEHPDDLCEHAILLEDGSVIIVDRFKHIVKLDSESNGVWITNVVAHHDVCLTPDGKIYTITATGADHRGLIVRFPVILELTSEGEPVEAWYANDHLEDIKQMFDQRSFLDTILDSLLAHHSWLETYEKLVNRGEAIELLDSKIQYDHFHMNTINVLPETPLAARDKAFSPGHLLICFRNVNQIAILERDTREVLWVWGEGELEWPHHPTMLENGNILIFDNGVFRKYSRVIELDPVARTIVWEYVADPPDAFYTYGKGSAQRLPNGNTLICEGDRGRVFEVTHEGEIVWEWFNALIVDGRRVQVYRMMRYSPEYVEALFEGP
jgi:hypothetical protein